MGFATTLAAVGVGMQAVGSLQEGRAAEANYQARAAMSRYNAQVNEMNARAAEMKAKFDQVRHQRRAQRIMGSLRAKLGASGARLDVGAPMLALADQASELELESALIGYEGVTRAARFRSQAGLQRVQADVYKGAGRRARQASYWGAGTSLLTGFSDMGEQGMFEGTPLGGLWGGSSGGSSSGMGYTSGYHQF